MGWAHPQTTPTTTTRLPQPPQQFIIDGDYWGNNVCTVIDAFLDQPNLCSNYHSECGRAVPCMSVRDFQ